MPTTTAPAPRSRRTTSWSSSATAVRAAAEPFQVGRPATAVFSLTATGTPASGRLARSSCSSTFSASAIASPPRTTRNACSDGSAMAIWSRWSATTWVADASPRRTARAICFAVAPTQVVDVLHAASPFVSTDGQPSACSRSASRSSTVSMPTDSRTRSAGTSSGEPAATSVCHPARVLDQRLDPAERLGRARTASSGCRSRSPAPRRRPPGTRPCRRTGASAWRRSRAPGASRRPG